MVEMSKNCIDPNSKVCKKCGELKLLKEFPPALRGPFGRHSYCHVCERARRKKRYIIEQNSAHGIEKATELREMQEKRKNAKEGYKLCCRCKSIKPVDQFNIGNKSTRHGRASYCKPCLAQWEKKAKSKTPIRRLAISLNTAKQSSKRKGIACTIQLDDLEALWNTQKGLCYYSGSPMTYDGEATPQSVSIDRKDSRKGYTLDNVVLCCTYVNRMKNDQPVEEFLWWCDIILSYQRRFSDEQTQRLETLRELCSRRVSRWSNWPPQQVIVETASGELPESSPPNGVGNQQPNCGKCKSTTNGSETRGVSSTSDNRPHERPTSLLN